MQLTIKRIFDIVVSTLGLILVSPLLLITSILIKLESKGPIVYKSFRVGQDFKIFGMYKFRSMYQDADTQVELMKNLNQYKKSNLSKKETEECSFCKILQRPCSPILISDNKEMCENSFFMRKETRKESAFNKIHNDPRVTKIGLLIRRTSIDELPQLFNVLNGDMSLIGNRPLPIYEAEKLTTDHAIERFNAPAGITGLWQVTKRGSKEVSQEERIELDKSYSMNWSLKKDFEIFLKTFPALLQKDNA